MTEATFRFSLALKNKIWQVVLCQLTGNLIIEERDESNQSIQYYPLSLLSGKVGHPFTISESDLWTSSLIYQHPYLVLEQYGDPNDPSVKSLMVVDVRKQQLEATIPQFQYVGIRNNVLHGVDPKDNSIQKEFMLKEVVVDQKLSLVSPVYYKAGSESCELVEEYLGIASSGLGCEYFESEDYIIICYYVRLGTKFDRWLMIVKAGETYFSAKIDEQMNGFASGGFFILNNLLVFIENGKKVNGIEI